MRLKNAFVVRVAPNVWTFKLRLSYKDRAFGNTEDIS
jgi:hypothetical protein